MTDHAPPPAVSRMLETPGFYAVSSDAFRRSFVVIEVEPVGVAHQLTPSPGFKRDGQLRRDGWAVSVELRGPFDSAPMAESAGKAGW